MAKRVNVHEAKTQLSKLLSRVERGEEFVIARDGKPVARLCPLPKKKPRVLGRYRGRIEIAADFDELPDDIARVFGMRE